MHRCCMEVLADVKCFILGSCSHSVAGGMWPFFFLSHGFISRIVVAYTKNNSSRCHLDTRMNGNTGQGTVSSLLLVKHCGPATVWEVAGLV